MFKQLVDFLLSLFKKPTTKPTVVPELPKKVEKVDTIKEVSPKKAVVPVSKFDKTSTRRLATCHPDIQKVMNEAIKYCSFYIVEGTRSKAKQDQYLASGASKVSYPNSYHNSSPSLAVDIAPYKDGAIQWKGVEAFEELAVIVKREAEKLNVPIEWAIDLWTWKDYPHWQLTSYRKK